MPSLFKRKKLKLWRKRPGVFTSHRTDFQKRKKGIAKIFKRGLLLAPVFLIFYFVFFSEFFAIEKIDIKGNQAISTENIEEAIKNESPALILGIFSENNFFLSNKEKTKESLLEKFPEIETIKIEKKFPDILEVEITEKNPLILWCRVENCYYL
ncbi:FtsQ-type POTRA domain-containing protein, partial [Patescibacteria group bacterium]|nr:FtsQ-type POTRA domain-containing protein [Patescibacteria group bacterium]